MVPVAFRYRRYLGWRKLWLLLLLLVVFLLFLAYLISSDNEDAWPDMPAKFANDAANGVAAMHPLKESKGDDEPVLQGHSVRHFPAKLNASLTGVSELLQDPMKLEELRASARKTLNYLISVQPDYDANAGSCRCGRIAELCSCCAKLTARRLRLDQTACVQFSYLVQRQAMRTRIVLAGSVIVEKVLSAASMPLLCAGSDRLELCARFRNATYKVQMHSRHKTRLSGCLDLLVSLSNITIYAYPLGCFRAQGHQPSGAVAAVAGGRGGSKRGRRPRRAHGQLGALIG